MIGIWFMLGFCAMALIALALDRLAWCWLGIAGAFTSLMLTALNPLDIG
jgi:hypothetical protein